MLHTTDISAMDLQGMLDREWLITNGLGGYSCSTLCGLNTRKYHGLLVAAMSPPVRRMVLLSQVDETVITSAGSFPLSSNEYIGAVSPHGYRHLRAFSPEPFPRWAFQGDGFTIEKAVHLIQGENTVCITYTLLASDHSVQLEIRPLMALRGIHELTYQWNGRLGAEHKGAGQLRIAATAKTPEVFFAHDGGFRAEPYWYLNAIYRREAERGYGGLEDLWNPGIFRWTLAPGQTCHLVCSAEPVELDRIGCDLDGIRTQAEARAGSTSKQAPDPALEALTVASKAFVVSSMQELQGDRAVNVIAQYPWSAPSARAGLTAFTGLFLIPGRIDEARQLILSLASRVQDGLVPTNFSESGEPPLYDGADTSLWFINAVHEYLRYTEDEQTVRSLLPALEEIIAAYRRGTRLGIRADADGLLSTKAPGLATTWMDARVGEWVITPRQGCAVELNALWFNALCIVAKLAARLDRPEISRQLATVSDSVQRVFNQRFWNPERNCCFDVIDGPENDPAIRPNQLLAMSLAFPVLSKDRHQAVLQIVINELLTPMGVRTLSPRDSAYQGRYAGEVVARDRAQHQGCAYPWLLGPLVTASLRAGGRNSAAINQARVWIEPLLNRLQRDGLGQLGELFDGDAPNRPGGAIASALSIGEILRCYVQDVLGQEPTPRTKPQSRVQSPGGVAPLPPFSAV